MADVSVRAAQAEDAVDIGRIQVETWRAAYQGILPTSVLDGLDVEAANAAWGAAIASPPSPRHRVLVALEQQWKVGFAALAPDEEDAAVLAVGPLLVEPRWGRRGHGSRLLAAAVDLARSDGFALAITWVPDGDKASQAFFQSAGWEPDGYVRGLDTGSGELREIRLHASLVDG